jgi:hypothetical protein
VGVLPEATDQLLNGLRRHQIEFERVDAALGATANMPGQWVTTTWLADPYDFNKP